MHALRARSGPGLRLSSFMRLRRINITVTLTDTGIVTVTFLRQIEEKFGVSLDSIAIPLFSSASSFMGFEGEFTRVVREEFISHSRVKIRLRLF